MSRGGRGGREPAARPRYRRAQLHALVRRLEAEPPVEPVGILTSLVRGELDQGTAPLAPPLDGPAHHGRTRSPSDHAAQPATRTDFDLRAPCAAAPKAGQEGELEATDDSPASATTSNWLLGSPLIAASAAS